MMDEAVLSQEVAENEAQPLTEVGSVGMIYPEEDSDGAQEILDKAVYASADGLLSDRTETEPGLVVFDLISYPQADKTGIEYNGMLSTFAECPGACVLVALQDSESEEFVASTTPTISPSTQTIPEPSARPIWRITSTTSSRPPVHHQGPRLCPPAGGQNHRRLAVHRGKPCNLISSHYKTKGRGTLLRKRSPFLLEANRNRKPGTKGRGGNEK